MAESTRLDVPSRTVEISCELLLATELATESSRPWSSTGRIAGWRTDCGAASAVPSGAPSAVDIIRIPTNRGRWRDGCVAVAPRVFLIIRTGLAYRMPAFGVNLGGGENPSKYKDLHAVTCRPAGLARTFRAGKSATGHIVSGISLYTQRQSRGRSPSRQKRLSSCVSRTRRPDEEIERDSRRAGADRRPGDGRPPAPRSPRPHARPGASEADSGQAGGREPDRRPAVPEVRPRPASGLGLHHRPRRRHAARQGAGEAQGRCRLAQGLGEPLQLGRRPERRADLPA